MRITLRVATALLLFLACASASATADTTFDRNVPAQPRGAVDISNVSGDVRVSSWDRAEVSVHAELSGGIEQLDVSSEGGRTVIRVPQSHSSGRGGEAHLQVKVPKDSELTVSAVSADLTTAGALGVQRLNTVSGDVTAELAGADLELQTVSGNVHLKGHGQPARLHVRTVSGDLHLEHGAGDLEASTVNGNLEASLDTARSVRARTTSGDVRFEGTLARGASVDATSVSGNVTVRASAEGGYAYEVSSFSGDIGDCFNATAERTSKYGPGTRLEGTRGDGAGHVRVKTMSGDIQLCDHR